ncbi:hypothetical protein [Occallatibacter savannae]|uniref:hypothetical protein n=1 Tax=Occallatibacter savannae TaxID=1002691 RepID=UPI000D697D4F|nr:hypothetical protein [Occallatibacter savannae]
MRSVQGFRHSPRFVRLCLALVLGPTSAFLSLEAKGSSLSPRGTKVEQHVAAKNDDWWQRAFLKLSQTGVLHFSEPVHEEITGRIFDCEDGCNDADASAEYAGLFIIAGVRWNDDPPFQMLPSEAQHTSCKTLQTIRFTTQPYCWYQIFTAAKKMAASGQVPNAANHAPLLARSHFGDLQFFHSMASQDGETAAETQRRVMIWMEFTWRVASGEYKLDTKLADVKIDGFAQFFGTSGWTVQDLFTAGNPALRRRITDVAFGSLLHTVEDSFAEGHVQREEASPGACSATPQLSAPPRVIEFHSYSHQDEKKHKEKDSRAAFLELFAKPANAVTVGKPLDDYYEKGASWETVRPYIDCIFTVVDPTTKASAGKEFAIEGAE